MSLGVSPSSSSPLTTHPRPLPPASRKRSSYTPSPRGTPRLETNVFPLISNVDEDPTLHTSSRGTTSVSVSSPTKVRQVDGTMGGLRERSEEELARAGRGELEEVLRREWEARDQILAKLQKATEERDRLKAEYESLLKSVAAIQGRMEEAYEMQSRMDSDLEERDELLERLRKRLKDAEREGRESQKRYIEQEKTFDIERQALQAQEIHLLQRLKTLSSTKSSNNAVNDLSLKDELASLNISHSTLLAKLNTLTKELHEVKIVNEQLVEENEGWEFLVREGTLNGELRQGGLLSSAQGEEEKEGAGDEGGEGGPESPESSQKGSGSRVGSLRRHQPLEALDEELELDEEMEELNSDLEAQSPIFEDEADFAQDLDADARSRQSKAHRSRSKSGHLAPPARGKRKSEGRTSPAGSAAGGEKLGDLPLISGGLDLAAELGRAEVAETGEMRMLGKGDEGEALRAEVKQLREANKALTLYCSKIIDRIIASEGFEHILAVDYKTRRGARPGTSGANAGRMGTKKSRTGLQALAPGLGEAATAAFYTLPSPGLTGGGGGGADGHQQEINDEPVLMDGRPKEKKVRPLSMMVRAISGPPSATVVEQNSQALPAAVESKVEETKSDKRARRGFSLDFRSLGFGSGPSPAPESPKPALKPLRLPSRASTTVVPTRNSTASSNSASAASAASAAAAAARKLDPHSEDEEDKRERHRMEATLKLMGIERPPCASATATEVDGDKYPYGGGWNGRGTGTGTGTGRSSGSSSSSHASHASRGGAGAGRGTPLSRLSAALGIGTGSTTTTATQSQPPLQLPDEEELRDPASVEKALKDFDKREAELVRALSKGQAEVGYTSPPKVGGRRKSAAGAGPERSEGGKASGAGAGGEREERDRTMSHSESVRTLWSMGSSRPNSADFGQP